ncbi:FAS1 domain-containing protein [Geopyxis carbonaria]|nr:FAS1 domain-containing protein [Geopyxis carbonaria]
MKTSLTALLLAPLLAAAQGASGNAPTLAALLNATSDLSALSQTLSMQPALLATLAGASNITILAPSNRAFEAFMATPQYDSVRDDNATLAALLQYHVLNGTYRAAALARDGRQFLPTLLGANAAFRNLSGAPQVVQAAEDDDRVVFTAGLNMRATVSRADIAFAGGVAHIVDAVLTPPMNVSTTATALNLTSLAGALVKTNLLATVDALADVTIFAPSNAAFRAIANLAGELSDADLASVLTYHVVPNATAYSTALRNNQKLRTLNGAELTVRIDDDDVFVNGAKVITADMLTNSGVVHVLDAVLNPDDAADTPDTEAETQSAAFPSATAATADPFVSELPASVTRTAGQATDTAATGAAARSVWAWGTMALAVGVAGLIV